MFITFYIYDELIIISLIWDFTVLRWGQSVKIIIMLIHFSHKNLFPQLCVAGIPFRYVQISSASDGGIVFRVLLLHLYYLQKLQVNRIYFTCYVCQLQCFNVLRIVLHLSSVSRRAECLPAPRHRTIHLSRITYRLRSSI